MQQVLVIARYRVQYGQYFKVQRFSAELFAEPLGEENKSRRSLNEENMSILHEEPCDNLFIVNILFFICISSYDVKNIDV